MSPPGQRFRSPSPSRGRRRPRSSGCSPSSRSTPRPSAATGGTSPSGWRTAPSSCGTRPPAGPCGRSPATRRPSCRSPSAPTASTSCPAPPTPPRSCGTSRPARRCGPTRATPGRSCRSRSAPTGSGSSPARRTGPRSSGTRKPASRSTRSSRRESWPSRTARTAPPWPRRRRTAPRRCGTPTTGKQNVRAAGPPGGRHLRRLQPGQPARHHRVVREPRHHLGRGHRQAHHPTGRHSNNVHSVAFTPDGRRVITGEREELVMMWDAATGAHVRTFVGHSAEILSIVPSPDGRTMLTGSRDGTARLWDLATGRELLALTTDGDPEDVGRRQPRRPVRRLGGGPPRARLPLHEAARRRRSISSSPRATAPDCWPRCGGANGRSRPSRWAGASPRSSSSSRRRIAVRPRRPRRSRRTSPTRAAASGPSWSRTTASASPSRRSPSPPPDGKATRVTFTVPLAPGPNKIRVRSADRDGSWESAASEVELTHPRVPGQRGRMYVVAVGVGDYAEKGLNLNYPAKDARALAELLRTRGGEAVRPRRCRARVRPRRDPGDHRGHREGRRRADPAAGHARRAPVRARGAASATGCTSPRTTSAPAPTAPRTRSGSAAWPSTTSRRRWEPHRR